MPILSVVVIYNRKIENVDTITSLIRAGGKNPEAFKLFKLIIYDNSPTEQPAVLKMPFQYEYKNDPDDGGLAAAYNCALKKAVADNDDWLLLFDSDTLLPVDFLEKFKAISEAVDDSVVAIVPKAQYKGRYFSPYKVCFGGINRAIGKDHVGTCSSEISAVGSGTMLRTAFMRDVGGFNTIFWLDCLDSWIFHTIHAKSKKVYVAPIVLEHELSILDYDKFMSEKRYLNILGYEALFMRLYKTKPENLFYWARLMKRSLTLFFTVKNKKYSLMTIWHLLVQIFHPGRQPEVADRKHPVLK